MMNLGVWYCLILIPGFVVIGLLFGIFKEKAALFVAGFNTLPKKEQAMYDKASIAREVRNSCFLWAAIMLAGALLSYFITPYLAIAAYVIWGVLFLKDLHVDAHKAFEKHLLK